jgi:hypothetical protein
MTTMLYPHYQWTTYTVSESRTVIQKLHTEAYRKTGRLLSTIGVRRQTLHTVYCDQTMETSYATAYA